MSGQTIQQIKDTNPESLWQFLQQLPLSFEAQIFYGLLLGGAVGIAANYTNKWIKDETEGWCLIAYLCKEHVRRTLASIFTYIGVSLGAVASGIFFTDPDHQFVGWMAVLWLGISNGFMIDAIANKAATPTWKLK